MGWKHIYMWYIVAHPFATWLFVRRKILRLYLGWLRLGRACWMQNIAPHVQKNRLLFAHTYFLIKCPVLRKSLFRCLIRAFPWRGKGSLAVWNGLFGVAEKPFRLWRWARENMPFAACHFSDGVICWIYDSYTEWHKSPDFRVIRSFFCLYSFFPRFWRCFFNLSDTLLSIFNFIYNRKHPSPSCSPYAMAAVPGIHGAASWCPLSGAQDVCILP